MSTGNIIPHPPVSYDFSLFLQPAGTTESQIDARVNVTENPAYEEIRLIVNLVIYHLSSSPKAVATAVSILLGIFLHDDRAATAFAALNGQEAIPTGEKVVEDLTTPPDFIILDIEDNQRGAIRWGRVKRGTSDLASRNEVFISKELCDAIMSNPNVLNLPQSQFQSTDMLLTQGEQARRLRIFHRALLLFVVSHEMMHALVKKTFSSAICTPQQATPGITDGTDGESGFYLENTYFQFELAAELPKEGLVKGQRLWKILNLLAEGKQVYILSWFHTFLLGFNI